MGNRLTVLRGRIDEMDRELVALLARRMEVAQQIIRIKTDRGQHRHAPAREQEILAARQAQAEELGVSVDLVGDVLKRIFSESYGDAATPAVGED